MTCKSSRCGGRAGGGGWLAAPTSPIKLLFPRLTAPARAPHPHTRSPQDAALERDEREKQKFVSITERTSSGGVAITDHKGNRTLVRPSLMHRQSVRTSLLHAVSRKGREMGEEEDETAALMQQVRARFDAAGVPIQVRGRLRS